LFALYGLENAPNSQALLSLSLSIGWAWWTCVDRRRCRAGLQFEFDAFVFFGWPIVVPYYSFRTRSSRTALSTCLLWGLYLIPSGSAVLAEVLRFAR
jgi:hypothetical protein